jgi:hypothetical protein
MLHPHLYTVEGLWMWGIARGDAAALDRARRATAWAWRHQLPSGGLPRYVSITRGEEPVPEQFDVTAQAIRAAVMLGYEPSGLKRAIQRLLEVAVRDAGGAALPYQLGAGHLNAWASMFGGQALQLVEDGPSAMSWEQLV